VESSNPRRILRRVPLPVLVTVVPLNVAMSFVTGVSVVPPAMRYGFYAVGGVAAGSWLLVHVHVRSPVARLALAFVPWSAILVLLADPASQETLLRLVLVAILPLGALGWFSFARHVEDMAFEAGGWRRFLRNGRRRSPRSASLVCGIAYTTRDSEERLTGTRRRYRGEPANRAELEDS
jgi:hypothetical protein